MTAAVELLAGADGWHGQHENPRQGWDPATRAAAARYGRLEPGADTYGRHAAPDDENRPPKGTV